MKQVLAFYTVISVLTLRSGCSERGEEMREHLLSLEAANRADSVMRNDSLAEAVAAYFDRHGTPNERMRAYYMLGRTYADLGELPRALETYNKAVEFADTTHADCRYDVLSRVFAQKAKVLGSLVQPRSQINELKRAEYYGKLANDTLIAIECYAQQAIAYSFLKRPDSVIIIKEQASRLFMGAGHSDRAALTLGDAIFAIIEAGDIPKARKYLQRYEGSSGLFDKDGNIQSGRELYYYLKGTYYLAINEIDSAESSFRKELRTGLDLNNQIAGNKGLQAVYERRGNSDSIAKFAKLGYELNDSAYSLSEMENIQRVQAIYNYNRNKLLAEQKTREADRAYNVILVLAILILIVLFCFWVVTKNKRIQLIQYQRDLERLEQVQSDLLALHTEEHRNSEEVLAEKNAEIHRLQKSISEFVNKQRIRQDMLENRLQESQIVIRLHALADANPYIRASQDDFRKLHSLINQEIPHFYTTVNGQGYVLSAIEYDVTLLIRTRFSPTDIHKLTGLSSGYISNMRIRLLSKIYGIKGSTKDYDQHILSIK